MWSGCCSRWWRTGRSTRSRSCRPRVFAVADLLNLEVDLLFSTTSTYVERDTEEAGDDACHRYGHSKDHRPELPQIVIGLAVTVFAAA
jgi:transposase